MPRSAGKYRPSGTAPRSHGAEWRGHILHGELDPVDDLPASGFEYCDRGGNEVIETLGAGTCAGKRARHERASDPPAPPIAAFDVPAGG